MNTHSLPAALLSVLLSVVGGAVIAKTSPARAQSAAEAATILSDDNGRISRFSGQKVPRFASLAYGKVNGRTGPGLNYPVRWRYVRRGLPVLVIRESLDWRKIRDPDGEEVWVHQRMLVARQTGILREISLLYPPAGEGDDPIAEVHPGVVGELTGCNRHWCKMRINGRQGRVPTIAIWGHNLSEPTASSG